MVISEAVKKAMEQNKLIYRKKIRHEGGICNTFIRPTNSYDTCIIMTCVDGREVGSCRNWNPTGDDLIADDWELWNDQETGKEERCVGT